MTPCLALCGSLPLAFYLGGPVRHDSMCPARPRKVQKQDQSWRCKSEHGLECCPWPATPTPRGAGAGSEINQRISRSRYPLAGHEG